MNRSTLRTDRRSRQAASRRSQRGVSLIESAVVTGLTAVVTSVVAPGFERALQRHHLDGAVAQLRADVQHTRSLAVARNAPLRISFSSTAAGSCYVVHDGAAGACSCGDDGQPVCRDGAQAERSVRFAAGERVGFSANVRSVLVDPVRGTVTPTATVQFSTRGGDSVRQVLNILGRVRSCSTDDSLPGYRRC